MIVEPSPHLHAEIIQLLKDEHQLTAQRTGMHVSDLTHCLTKSYWNRVDPAPPSDDEVLYWSIGWAMERVLISRLHMEPIILDGITGTPDFSIDGLPADLKTTRMPPESSGGCLVCGEPYAGHTKGKNGHAYEKSPPVPFKLPETWVRQFKAYRYMLNRTVKTVSYEWVPAALFGTERKPLNQNTFAVVIIHLVQPAVQVLTLHFTEGELESHWAWMVDRSNALESMLSQHDPMEYMWNEPWECTNCAYSLRCGLAASLQGVSK